MDDLNRSKSHLWVKSLTHMTITFWHGLQQGPILDTFDQIIHEWNKADHEFKVQTKPYSLYHLPAVEALDSPDEDQPNFVLAPEYMTGKMWTALGEKKVIPLNDLLPSEQLGRIADIVKRTFGKDELASLPFNPACGVLYANGNLVSKMPTTLEELEEMSSRLIEEGKVEGGYTCAWPAA